MRGLGLVKIQSSAQKLLAISTYSSNRRLSAREAGLTSDHFDSISMVSLLDAAPVLDARKVVSSQSQLVKSEEPMSEDNRMFGSLVVFLKFCKVILDDVTQFADSRVDGLLNLIRIGDR